MPELTDPKKLQTEDGQKPELKSHESTLEVEFRENLEAWTNILADISQKTNEIEQLKQQVKFYPYYHDDERRSGQMGFRILKARDELSSVIDTLKKILTEQDG